MERIRRDIEKLRAEIPERPSRLTWEARKLLTLYAKGYEKYTNHHTTWSAAYREASKTWGPKLNEDLSTSDLFYLLFIIHFLGEEAEWKAYCHAFTIAPNTVKQLFTERRNNLAKYCAWLKEKDYTSEYEQEAKRLKAAEEMAKFWEEEIISANKEDIKKRPAQKREEENR